jgi:hypothetical protein
METGTYGSEEILMSQMLVFRSMGEMRKHP